MRKLAFLIVLLLLCSQVWADPLSAARDHAWKLYRLYEQAQMSGNEQAYESAILAQPQLGKQAFLSTLIYLTELSPADYEDQEAALEFAGDLALQIAVLLDDMVPLDIIGRLHSGDPSVEGLVGQYAEFVFSVPQQSSTAYTQSPAQQPTSPQPTDVGGPIQPEDSVQELEQMQTAMLYVMKLFRVILASALNDPTLMIQELDTYSVVEERMGSSLKDSLDLGGEDFRELRDAIALARLVTLAEVGLLGEFEEQAGPLLARIQDPSDRAAALLVAFRSALRQGRLAEARSLFARMDRDLKSQSQAFSPLLKFAVETARVQLDQTEGRQLTDSQARQKFLELWRLMEGYDPLADNAKNSEFSETTPQFAYWMDELQARGQLDEELFKILSESMDQWVKQFDMVMAKAGQVAETDFDLEPTFGGIIFAVSALDQYLYMLQVALNMEGFNQSLSPTEAQGIYQSMVEFSNLLSEVEVNFDEPGFPPIDFGKASLMMELQGRSKLVEAKLLGQSKDQRQAAADQAKSYFAQSQNPFVQIRYLLELGEVYLDAGSPQKAVTAWREALTKADDYGFLQQSLRAKVLLAKEYGRQQDWKNASLFAGQAETMLQESVAYFSSDPRLASELRSLSAELTQVTVKSKIQANDPQQALEQLLKGQQIQAAAMKMGVGTSAQSEAQAVDSRKNEVAVLAQQVKQLENMPASATRDQLLEKTQKLLADTRTDFLLKSRELRDRYSSLYTQALRFDPLNLPDIQKALPPEVAVIQYFPTPDALYIFLVTRDDFRLRQVEIGSAELDRLAEEFTRRIPELVSNDEDLEKSSKRLHSLLLDSVAEDIKDRRILVLIPTGRLSVLPFSALMGSNGRYLIDDKVLLKLAKPTDFLRIASTTATPVKSVVAFADSGLDLPAAAKEGQDIADLFKDSKLFKGKDVTKENFKEFGGKAEVLPLATHGEWDINNSLNNYLQMSGRERLAQEEIFDMSLENTSIVTLSACNTAMADRVEAGYVASLAEAFWLAGSRSVVATLWAVNDDSTAELMSSFYRSLKDGSSKAEALIGAQRKVRDTPGYEHPYYWAGFVLFGDWR